MGFAQFMDEERKLVWYSLYRFIRCDFSERHIKSMQFESNQKKSLPCHCWQKKKYELEFIYDVNLDFKWNNLFIALFFRSSKIYIIFSDKTLGEAFIWICNKFSWIFYSLQRMIYMWPHKSHSFWQRIQVKISYFFSPDFICIFSVTHVLRYFTNKPFLLFRTKPNPHLILTKGFQKPNILHVENYKSFNIVDLLSRMG